MHINLQVWDDRFVLLQSDIEINIRNNRHGVRRGYVLRPLMCKLAWEFIENSFSLAHVLTCIHAYNISSVALGNIEVSGETTILLVTYSFCNANMLLALTNYFNRTLSLNFRPCGSNLITLLRMTYCFQDHPMSVHAWAISWCPVLAPFLRKPIPLFFSWCDASLRNPATT